MNATNCSPQLENILDINITQIGIDECVTANCTHSSGCISRHEERHVPTITTAGSISLVSVTVVSRALCGCAARESPRLSCSSYQTNPCLNDGTCVDTDLGYRLVKFCLVRKQNASSSVSSVRRRTGSLGTCHCVSSRCGRSEFCYTSCTGLANKPLFSGRYLGSS